jgi:two-component system sensor histidine kinase/response regulator
LLYEALVAVLGRKQEKEPQIITRHLLTENKLTNQRILLAEDNAINQKLAVILLKKAGYGVDAVETGLQVVEKAKEGKYHAILMDVQMPEMDGFEATGKIREWEASHNQHIPIIAMTAHAMKGDRERCLEAGMDDYVSKPLEIRILLSVLDRWMQFSVTKEDQPAQTTEPVASAEVPTSAATEMPKPSIEVPASAAVEPPKPRGDDPPMNFDQALDRFGGERAFLVEMCRDYAAGLPERIRGIKTAIMANNATDLNRLAHNLKGVSASFSADPVTRLAAELETLGRQEDLSAAPELLTHLEAEAYRLVKYLHENGIIA